MSGAEAASARYRELVAQACQAHAARNYAAAAALKGQVRVLGKALCHLFVLQALRGHGGACRVGRYAHARKRSCRLARARAQAQARSRP